MNPLKRCKKCKGEYRETSLGTIFCIKCGYTHSQKGTGKYPRYSPYG